MKIREINKETAEMIINEILKQREIILKSDLNVVDIENRKLANKTVNIFWDKINDLTCEDRIKII